MNATTVSTSASEDLVAGTSTDAGDDDGPYSTTLAQFGLALNVILVVAIIVNNGLVIACYVTSGRVRDEMNAFLMSMACTDLLHGCLSIPVNLAIPRTHFYSAVGMTVPSCVAAYNISNTLWMVGMYNILLVTAHRFITIVIPLRYTTYLTQRNCCIALLLLWSFVIFYVYIPTFITPSDPSGRYIRICNSAIIINAAYAYTILYFFLYTPLIAVVLLYLAMYLISRKHRLRMAVSAFGEQAEEQAKFVKISKAAKTTFTLSALYICCWVPNFVCMHIVMDCVFRRCPSGFRQDSFALATSVVIFLGYLNAAINPCIYGLRNPVVRARLEKTLRDARVLPTSDSGSAQSASGGQPHQGSMNLQNLATA